MNKFNQRKMEIELQKELAIAYVTPFCMENNLSLDKLRQQKFILSCHECAFAQPVDVKPNGLVNDVDTMPKTTLIVKLDLGQLTIEKTEFTKKYLKKE